MQSLVSCLKSPSVSSEKPSIPTLITPIPTRAMTVESPFPTDKGLKEPICVFCGSSPGNYPLYAAAAAAVSAALAKENIPVVYGGGRRGIMGVVAHAALEAGGHVHGVLPRALVSRASEHTPSPGPSSGSGKLDGAAASQPESGQIIRSKEGIGKDLLEDDVDGRLTMQLTGSMHERKQKMAQLSTGGFVVLPGGYGTYEEMMEMITWNQLGIHRVPVLILNIGNFYTPLRGLLENAVTAGFIAPQNLSLCQIVDLPGGSAANLDASRAEEWGPATISALDKWSFAPEVGYGLDWKEPSREAGTPANEETDDDDFSLFTTMRFTSVLGGRTVTKDDVPLLDGHIRRLREGHGYFATRKSAKWGEWPGDEAVWNQIQGALQNAEHGDWRVRVVLHPSTRSARVEVQVVPAPPGIPPFRLDPETNRPDTCRPLILDSEEYDAKTENWSEKYRRLYKTTDRRIYDTAGARAAKTHPGIDHPEVLLHTATRLLESVTSNVALQYPASEDLAHASRWVTPKLDRSDLPFLDGVMRRELLARGVIVEGEVTIDDWHRAKKEGWRVIGFNGLRGVWEAQPV